MDESYPYIFYELYFFRAPFFFFYGLFIGASMCFLHIEIILENGNMVHLIKAKFGLPCSLWEFFNCFNLDKYLILNLWKELLRIELREVDRVAGSWLSLCLDYHVI